MKKLQRLLTGTLIFLSISLMTACNKKATVDPVATVNHPAQRVGVTYQGSFSDWPDVEEGMLHFRDSTHISNYIDFLDSAIKFNQPGTADESQDPEEILQGIEDVINFTSYRNVTTAAFDALNEEGWDNPSDIPEKSFINDITIRSILSNNADVRVGDKITHFINRDYAVTVAANDATTLQKLHDLPLSATILDIQNVDLMGGNIEVEFLSVTDLNTTPAFRGTGTVGFNIGGITVKSTELCIDPKKVTLDNLVLSALTINGVQLVPAQFLVSWGDGTSNTYYSTSSSGYSYNGALHTYPRVGNYTINVKARCTACASPLGWDAEKNFPISVPSLCNYKVQHTEIADIRDNYQLNRFMRCKDWVEQWTSPFGVSKHSIGASTVSYHQENSKWKESRIDEVQAEYSTTKSDGTCNVTWGDAGISHNGNTKSAEAKHTNQGWVGWSEVLCVHKLRIGNNWVEYYKTLTPCH